MTRGNERTRTPVARLHDDGCDRQAADNAVALVVIASVRLGAGRIFADDGTHEQDIAHQAAVLWRIAHIGTARQHGNGQTARLQRTAVCRAVIAERHAADGYHARSGKRCADLIGDFQAIRRRLARADDGYGGNTVEIRPASAHIQHGRRIRDRPQAVRVSAVTDGNDLDILFRAGPDDLLRFGRILVAQQIDMGLAQLTRRSCQCLPVGGEHRLRRAEGIEYLSGCARAESALERKPNIAES